MEVSAVSGVSYVVRIHCCNAGDMVLVHVGWTFKKNIVFQEILALGSEIKSK